MNIPAAKEALRELRASLEPSDSLAAFKKRAAVAWEEDMQPACTALESALREGGMDALRSLRTQLPLILSGVTRRFALAKLLSVQMGAVVLDGMISPRRHATNIEQVRESLQYLRLSLALNAGIDFSHEPHVSPRLRQWRGRQIFPTDFSSADLRGLSRELRERSIFSARTTNADYLEEVAETLDSVLAGEIGMSEARYRLMLKLKVLGYDPEKGFPQDMADIPSAKRGTLRDLSSEKRIDLMLETNLKMAAGYSMVLEGNGVYARYAFPAWELDRIYDREIERGSPKSHTTGWPRRWEDAGDSVQWEGAKHEPMVALKDSPIWLALGSGAGGYEDTLGNPYPPFAFRSGFGWRPKDRGATVALGLLSLDATPAPMQASLTPAQQEIKRAFERLSPDLKAALLKELEEEA